MSSIRQGKASDLPAICDLWNAVWPNHFRGLEELRRETEMVKVECRPQFLLIEKDGQLVGAAEFNREFGSYHLQKWSVGLSVLPAHRQLGIGSDLLNSMLGVIEPQDAISATCRAGDDDLESIRFLEKRGFHEIKRDFESELDLASVPKEILEVAIDCPATIMTVAEIDSPKFRQAFHQAFETIRVDTPRTDPPTPMEFEHFQELVIDEPDFLLEASRVAFIDGEIAGFTGLYKMEQPGGLFQWLTGVRREHRGKKIAKALKLEALKWAVTSGYKTVRTDNDTRNAPMLAINDQLGFRRLPGMITFRRELGAEARG